MNFMLDTNSIPFALALAIPGFGGAALLLFRRSPSLTTIMTGGVAGVAGATLAFFLAIPGFAPMVAVSVVSGLVVARVLLSRATLHPSISPYR